MLYKLARGILAGFFYVLGLKIEGRENIPSTGALLAAGNHVSNWDDILLAIALNRPVCFMAKAELFHFPPLAWLLQQLNVFPVERGKGDLQAIRTAMQHLQAQRVLGIFPEGTRNKNQDLSKVHGGLGLLACKGEVQVLPVTIIGSGHTLPCGWFHPFRIRIAPPVSFILEPGQKKNSENFTLFSQNVMKNIYSML